MSHTKPLRSLSLAFVLLFAACSDADDSDTSTSTDDSDAAASEPMFAGLDGTVTLLTETSGGGLRPLLEWEPVDEADHYAAYLYAPNGDVYWAWTGHGTSVHVGGEPQLRDGASGPSVVEEMTWAVMAHDGDGLPLAVSQQRPIAP